MTNRTKIVHRRFYKASSVKNVSVAIYLKPRQVKLKQQKMWVFAAKHLFPPMTQYFNESWTKKATTKNMFLNVTTGQLSLSPSPKVSQRRTAPWARAETFFRFLVSSCSRAAPSCSRRREGTQPHRGPRRLDRSGAAQRTGESRARRQLGWSAEEGEQDRLACVEKKAAQSLRVRTVASTLQDGLNFGTFDRAIALKQRRFCFVSVHVS